MAKISIVIPCLNEEKNVSMCYNEISKVIKKDIELSNLSFEFIFVDDGSNDQTLEIIKELSKYDKQIKFISFSRNFKPSFFQLESSRFTTFPSLYFWINPLQPVPVETIDTLLKFSASKGVSPQV